MELVKKNLVSIICGAVALLAIVALFWPISGYYAELQAKANTRKDVYSSLKGILDKQRSRPITDLESPEPKPLEQFPNQLVIDRGKAVTDLVKSESVAMLDLAVKMNQRKPLTEGALPNGKSYVAQVFRRDYNRAVLLELFTLLGNTPTGGNVATNPDPRAIEDAKKAYIWQVMKAGFPPTEMQIQAERAKAEAEIKQKTAFDGRGQPINAAQIQAELQEALPKVADRLKSEAAKSCQVYIDPTSLHVNLALNSGGPTATPEATVIFNAQVGLWIQEDVAHAIGSANKDSKSVVDSPVKHLVKIDVPDEIFRLLPAGPMPEGMPAVSNDPSVKPPVNYALSPTGRTSNGVYDVVPFTVKLNVDAEQIPRVLQELSRNKFLTVTNCNITTVDSELMHASGYFYGDKPVVTLDLQCEALILRKWTEPLMPLHVKQALGLVPLAAPGQ